MKNELNDFLASDDAIYHFTKKEVAIEYILNNKELKFGSFSNTNDPYEYKTRMQTVSGWGWKEKHNVKLSESTVLLDQLIKSSGFLSFSKNKSHKKLIQYGYEKSRMWSQYGENNAGVCLVFSKTKLLANIKKIFSDELYIYANNVEYIEIGNRFDNNTLLIDGDHLDNLDINDIVLNHIQKNSEKIFFQKQSDYKDETEFRIVLFSKENTSGNELLIDISSCIKMVILGDSFPEVYNSTINSLLSNLDIPCKKLHWESSMYFLLNL